MERIEIVTQLLAHSGLMAGSVQGEIIGDCPTIRKAGSIADLIINDNKTHVELYHDKCPCEECKTKRALDKAVEHMKNVTAQMIGVPRVETTQA